MSRLEVVQRIQRRRLTQREAAALLGLSLRHVERLCRAYREHGVSGLVSKRRGAPSNNQINHELRTAAMALVHAEYSDFCPTLAQEQLAERHGINVSRETLRKWMVAEKLFVLDFDTSAREFVGWTSARSPSEYPRMLLNACHAKCELYHVQSPGPCLVTFELLLTGRGRPAGFR